MLVVEPVRNADVDPVARLALNSLKERYAQDWLAEHANVAKGTFLVARDVPTKQIVGFAPGGESGGGGHPLALAEKSEGEGHLLALAVDAQRRGQGIGRALLADVRERMRRQGAHALRLD